MRRMTALLYAVPLMAGLAFAQAPAEAPAGSTGMCRDGSYWTGPVKKGACRGHKGVQDWYAGSSATGAVSPAAAPETAPAATPPVAAAAAAAPAPMPAPAAPAAPAPTRAAAAKADMAPAATAAAGGGPGLVWVNTKSGVYHCPADRWYGKTKSGAYMSEADAIAKGDHADHGKACPK